MQKVLVTGAGSGFGKLFSLELAKRGYIVNAGVEVTNQITSLQEEAKKQNVQINIFKLDITNEFDREYATKLDIDILVNNAGIGQGGAIVDIPLRVLRQQFEVNFFATIALTQAFLHIFHKRKSGRVVFISSIAGLITAEQNGAYCASKHALEATAESLRMEMIPFGISIATINPGPYLTGFNDRLIEASREWYEPEKNIFDHSNLSFPIEQSPADVHVKDMVDVIVDPHSNFRNIFPKEFVDFAKDYQKNLWDMKSDQ
ncbi:SDR family oxidoreductase [Acinetobacter sp. NIPH 2100]|uniref:SDR family oxidoreductase n=1 Tax=Acinetobacter sp. NIPH 2100 TaxID=1217708 RepID=UPI0002CF1C18|nr:SDR family oxidoreductase [Acinetobacter sp. NIPH 2100]ENX42908.1 hypothetical protein F887_01078 [Acinetobacter sp. NIPH 2100]